MKSSTPLGRVVRRGSLKAGFGHWWTQRVTAVALIPLSLWFIAALLALPSFDYAVVLQWLHDGWHAVLLSLLVGTLCWHSSLGVQVVIEDYVHGHATKLVSLLLAQFVHVLLATAGVFAVIRVATAAV